MKLATAVVLPSIEAMADAKKDKLGPEFAIGPDGKKDAAIHLPILDNEEADRAFQASVIRKDIKDGMAPETARQLYGNYLETTPAPFRICLLEPVPEIFEAARYLDEAVTAHLKGQTDVARELFTRTNRQEIRNWNEKLWGPGSSKRYRVAPKSSKVVETVIADKARMPSSADKNKLIERDGHHCRFCGIPVIREEIRTLIRTCDCYREAVPWGPTNTTQHAAFQAMWLHYDHVIPHSLGGPSTVENMVICCAPCNCARMECTLAEVGLFDPRDRDPVRSAWDGLERFRHVSPR